MTAQTRLDGSFCTAIVPAAGMGTRFLPATKTMPKELLPLGATPAIEFVTEEAAEAGAQRLVLVTAPGKRAVVEHFRPHQELEGELRARGKDELLRCVRHASGLIDVESVQQRRPLGLGHAVACARKVLGSGDEAVAVLLPDDLILPAGVLNTMSRVRSEHGGSVLCAVEVADHEVSSYGCLGVSDTGTEDVKRVHRIVEKPEPDRAPSTFAVVGRYLLDGAIFEALLRTSPGWGGEVQLTDAIAALIDDGHPVHVVVERGTRHDLGNPSGFLKAGVDSMLRDPVRGPDFKEWLNTRL